MSHEVYKSIIKKEMESADLNKVPKQDVVWNALRELSVIDDNKFNKQIIEFEHKIKEFYKKMNEVNQELLSYVDGYYKALLEGL